MADAKNTQAQFDATAGRIRDLNEKLITTAKQSSTTSLDVYEKALADMLRFSENAADSAQNDVISAITKAHTEYISSISKVFSDATRDALK